MKDQAIRVAAKRQAERIASELERTARSIRRAALGFDIERCTPCSVIAEIIQDQDRKENLNAILWQLVMTLEEK